MSRTPDSDICMVRGIGVAESVSTSMLSRRFFICSLWPHAEALLLVDDHQAQVMGVHIARQQAMRAYEHIHAAVRETLERRSLLLRRAEAAEHLDGHAERLEAVLEVRKVLLRQDGGRAQHHNLLAYPA